MLIGGLSSLITDWINSFLNVTPSAISLCYTETDSESLLGLKLEVPACDLLQLLTLVEKVMTTNRKGHDVIVPYCLATPTTLSDKGIQRVPSV